MYRTQLTRRALTEDSDTVHAVLFFFIVVVVFVAAAVVAVPFVSMSVSIFIVS